MELSIPGYIHIVRIPGVCNGNPTIKGTRIEPWHIANYGTIDDILEDCDLTEEQVKEALNYY